MRITFLTYSNYSKVEECKDGDEYFESKGFLHKNMVKNEKQTFDDERVFSSEEISVVYTYSHCRAELAKERSQNFELYMLSSSSLCLKEIMLNIFMNCMYCND